MRTVSVSFDILKTQPCIANVVCREMSLKQVAPCECLIISLEIFFLKTSPTLHPGHLIKLACRDEGVSSTLLELVDGIQCAKTAVTGTGYDTRILPYRIIKESLARRIIFWKVSWCDEVEDAEQNYTYSLVSNS